MQTALLMSKDFDFQIGFWRVKHRRLKERLAASDDWEEFDGASDMRTVLGGNNFSGCERINRQKCETCT